MLSVRLFYETVLHAGHSVLQLESPCYCMEQLVKALNGRHFILYRQIFVNVEN